MSNATPGKTIKYNDTTTLSLDIPDEWDRANISAIAVSVTDESGTVLSSGAATIYMATKLDSASLAHATSITLFTGAATLYPGDRILIGAAGEIKEIRDVISYNSSTRVVTIEELRYAHADDAPVLGMWATYALDTGTVATWTDGLEIWIRWNPNSTDPEYIQQAQIGETAFASQGFWERFQRIYPTEYISLQGRDLTGFLADVESAMRTDMACKGFIFDKIQDMELLQMGLLRRARLLYLEGSGDADVVEYDRAEKLWGNWLDAVAHLPIWEDKDGDEIVDDEEVSVHGLFFESARYR
jgi:hypothetical protein